MPRFVSPRIFSSLWLFLGLLAIGAGLVATAPIPIFVTGTAVVMAQPRTDPHEYILILFLPSAYHGDLELAQTVIIEDDLFGQYETEIIELLPEVMSPAHVRQRFDPPLTLSQATTVAFANWQLPLSNLPASAYEGSVFMATVVVGNQPLWSLLLSRNDS
ncbi:MAG: hypothetical protein KDE56_11960 [Anaerolineales bacterium]|nr:hypothetical protein [Anaerolineales bacterium]